MKPNTNPNKTDTVTFETYERIVREWLKDIKTVDWQHHFIQVEHDINAKLDALIKASNHDAKR